MKKNPHSVFNQRLRAARELRKLTQSTLAQRAGLHPGTISRFESGDREPHFEDLIRLADVLECTTDYLLGRASRVHFVWRK